MLYTGERVCHWPLVASDTSGDDTKAEEHALSDIILTSITD